MMLRPRPTELEESLNSWPFVRRGNPLDCLLVVWHQNQSGIFPLSFRALYAIAFFVPVLDSSDHFLHPPGNPVPPIVPLPWSPHYTLGPSSTPRRVCPSKDSLSFPQLSSCRGYSLLQECAFHQNLPCF